MLGSMVYDQTMLKTVLIGDYPGSTVAQEQVELAQHKILGAPSVRGSLHNFGGSLSVRSMYGRCCAKLGMQILTFPARYLKAICIARCTNCLAYLSKVAANHKNHTQCRANLLAICQCVQCAQVYRFKQGEEALKGYL